VHEPQAALEPAHEAPALRLKVSTWVAEEVPAVAMVQPLNPPRPLPCRSYCRPINCRPWPRPPACNGSTR